MPHVGRRGTKYWLNSLLNALPRTDGQRSSCDRHSRVTHPSLVSDILVSAEEGQSLSPVPVLRVGPQPPGTQDFPVSMGEGEGRRRGGGRVGQEVTPPELRMVRCIRLGLRMGSRGLASTKTCPLWPSAG